MKTFILIHGSWHSAWNWHKIVPLLEKAGHFVLAIDLPAVGINIYTAGNRRSLINLIARGVGLPSGNLGKEWQENI